MIGSKYNDFRQDFSQKASVFIVRVPNIEKYDSMLRDQAYLDYVAYLKRNSITADIIDLRDIKNLRLLEKIPPKSKVIISVLRTEQLEASFKISRYLKFKKQCLIIYGRLINYGAFSTPYFSCQEKRYIDYIIPSKCGEAAVAEYLRGNSSFLINNHKKQLVPASSISEIDINLLTPSEVPAGNSFITYELSRGCTNRCFYCSNSLNKFQVKPVEVAIKEIQYLIDLNKTRKIVFVSPEINFDQSYLNEFIEKLTPLGVEWTSYAVPKGLNDETLSRMYKSGCRLLSFGVESANQKILSALSKKTNLEEISSIFKICGRLGIKTQMHVIVGFPQETNSDIEKIKNFIEAHKNEITNVNISDLVIPKDSRVSKYPEKLGIVLDKTNGGEFYPFFERGSTIEDRQRAIKTRINDLNNHIHNLNISRFNISTTFDESFERLYLYALSISE